MVKNIHVMASSMNRVHYLIRNFHGYVHSFQMVLTSLIIPHVDSNTWKVWFPTRISNGNAAKNDSSFELSISILLSIVVPRLSIFFYIWNREKTNYILSTVSIMKEKKKLDENKFVLNYNKYTMKQVSFKYRFQIINEFEWWKKFLNLKFVMIAIIDERLSNFDILLRNIRFKLSMKQI